MKSIFKYPLILGEESRIALPMGAKLRFFDLQGTRLCAWFEVNLQNPSEYRTFHIRGTGTNIPDNFQWLGTTASDKPFVWHLYEEVAK